MNRMTVTAIYMVLMTWPGLFAHAQPVSTPAAQFQSGAGQAHTNEAIRLGSNVSRQEFECVLSGVCPVGEGTRVNG